MVGLERPVGEARGSARLVAIAAQTGSSRSDVVGRPRRCGSSAGPAIAAGRVAAWRPGRARERDLGEGPEAAGRRVDGGEPRLGVGDPLGRASPRRPRPRLGGSSGPPSARRQERGDGRADSRDPRTATSAGRRRRGASRPAPASGVAGPAGARGRGAGGPGALRGTTASSVAVGQQDRARVAGDRRGGADRGRPVAARPQVDPGRQPGQRIGDRVGDRADGRAGTSGGSAGTDRPGHEVATTRRDARVRGRGEDRPDRAHRVAGDRRRR